MKRNIFNTLLLLLVVGLVAPQGLQAQDQELPLGSAMPLADRAFQNHDGSQMTLGSMAGEKGTVVIFWSNQCAWVDKYEDRVLELATSFTAQGFNFVLVNANDANAFPQEAAEATRKRATDKGYAFPYLIDNGSALAKALGASRTPHTFIFDANRTLVYVGTLDDSPGDPGNVETNYVNDALSALVGAMTVEVPKTKAFGCTIKFYQ